MWKKYLLGCLFGLISMLAIGYFMWQGFGLLGYSEPREAPVPLRYAGMIVFLVIMVFVFNFVAGDTYNQLQERRREKKKRNEELY